ncbi:hypothetical protein [Sorangium sp. So ce394]|uniref:hypothetical protein n=1 Tax=Sorangium sp. So ce394 TaxID=3133310 RepID=UPI003F5B59AA
MMFVARQMSPERQREWQELRAFFDFWERRLFPSFMPPDDPRHPANVLEQIAEELGPSKALQGLKQAIHDIVEQYGHLSGEEIRRADTALAANGLLTFSEVRRRYWSRYRAVLKRGAIRNETEFYLLKGIADDLTSGPSDDERAQISTLLSEYEAHRP